MTKLRWYAIIFISVAAIGGLIWFAVIKLQFITFVPTASPIPLTSILPSVSPSVSTMPAIKYQTIKASDIANVPSKYNYSIEVPESWQAEVVKEIEAVNLYDPHAEGTNNLEKSQVFIRYFEANSFLTLSTVDILERSEFTIQTRPAVRYVIQKKASTANFANQPSWRNQKHTVTDVRLTDTNPSIFYVVAQRPGLNNTVYNHLFDTIKLESASASLVEPIKEFKARITKKSFGTYVTPQNSPVQPEKFNGYHTGVDVEYNDVKDEVVIYSITSGTVIASQVVNGYGGVLVVRHTVGDKQVLTLYGHLDPASIVKSGSTVITGQEIGQLGDGGTSETDGERKHLHFAMLKGDTVNFAGYVKNKEQLDSWYNPLDFY
jgi:murein DD-endopeptidase MepM/ murein hydrolase activator NlpD